MPTHQSPLVGVLADVQTIAPHAHFTVQHKYIHALAVAGQVTPVIIPPIVSPLAANPWLDRLDGLVLTGAYSMVQPALYEQTPIDQAFQYDAARDQSAFAMIHAAIKRDLPLFGICRGFQEINVACGGSLHQAVHTVAGLDDHREDKTAPTNVQYQPSHSVNLVEDGVLAKFFQVPRIKVNSLHVQGVDRLGDGLSIEARADDGLVEAISIDAMRFGLAVQWHPEWEIENNPTQQVLFKAFGEAARQTRMETKHGKP